MLGPVIKLENKHVAVFIGVGYNLFGMAESSSTHCLPTFLLAGQSNMLGLGLMGVQNWSSALRAAVDASTGWEESNVWSFGFQAHTASRCEGWRRYRVQVHQKPFCVPGQPMPGCARDGICQGGPGPEISFVQIVARRLLEITPHAHHGGFGIVKAAAGGSSMKHWATKGMDMRDRLHEVLQLAMLANFTTEHAPNGTRHEQRTPSCIALRGLVWLQGEHEQKSVYKNHTTHEQISFDGGKWAERFVQFVHDLREAAHAPRLAVVVGRVLPHPPIRSKTHGMYVSASRMSSSSKLVREQQEIAVSNLTASGVPTTLVDLDNLTIVPWRHRPLGVQGFDDVAHLDMPSLVEAGRRFGEAMVDLLVQTKHHPNHTATHSHTQAVAS